MFHTLISVNDSALRNKFRAELFSKLPLLDFNKKYLNNLKDDDNMLQRYLKTYQCKLDTYSFLASGGLEYNSQSYIAKNFRSNDRFCFETIKGEPEQEDGFTLEPKVYFSLSGRCFGGSKFGNNYSFDLLCYLQVMDKLVKQQILLKNHIN